MHSLLFHPVFYKYKMKYFFISAVTLDIESLRNLKTVLFIYKFSKYHPERIALIRRTIPMIILIYPLVLFPLGNNNKFQKWQDEFRVSIESERPSYKSSPN